MAKGRYQNAHGQQEFDSIIKYLDMQRKEYILTMHGRKRIIQDLQGGKMEFLLIDKNDRLKPSHLGALSSFKSKLVKYYHENKESVISVSLSMGKPKNIEFFSNIEIRQHYSKPKDIFEVDISKAYPTAAKLESIITSEYYEKMLENMKKDILFKKAYVSAVGSLATKTDILRVYFDSGIKKTDLIEHSQKDTFYLRDLIAAKVDAIMQNLKYLDSLFYWVDATFVKDFDTAKQVQFYLQSRGYESTIDKYSAYVENDKLYLQDLETKQTKYFPIPKIY